MKTDRDRWTVLPYRHGDRQGQMDRYSHRIRGGGDEVLEERVVHNAGHWCMVGIYHGAFIFPVDK